MSSIDPTPDYLRRVTHTLTVFPEVVVLPEETSSDENVISGGSINSDTTFDCNTINLKRNGNNNDADVVKLQTILKARGYYTRQIDGDFGKYTEKAVMKLQTAQGNTPDGWFGQKTCQKLQGISTTSNANTGTANKKQTSYTITDFKQYPDVSADLEALSSDVKLITPYTKDKYSHLRELQKTEYVMKLGKDVIKKHMGYINEIKINYEDDTQLIEISLVGYTVFLEQNVEIGEDKTAKKSELIKWLVEHAGLKLELNLEGLTDTTYTLKAQTTEKASGGGLTQLSGEDCTGHMQTNQLSARNFDINACGGNTKIGNSNANYAKDTAGKTAKEAIMDIFNRFKYGRTGNGDGYDDNEKCPQKMWNTSGKIYGNCADIARLVKAMGEVHGLKVGIRHAYKHYYNLIELDGHVYRFDCCFTSHRGYMSPKYGGEKNNDLVFLGGPWSQ